VPGELFVGFVWVSMAEDTKNPPLGAILAVMTLSHGVFPFMILSVFQLALITYWPGYTLFLPNLLMPR
jgi:TRAP-type C4-dicarboxylate transport system permease large subunit